MEKLHLPRPATYSPARVSGAVTPNKPRAIGGVHLGILALHRPIPEAILPSGIRSAVALDHNFLARTDNTGAAGFATSAASASPMATASANPLDHQLTFVPYEVGRWSTTPVGVTVVERILLITALGCGLIVPIGIALFTLWS